MDPLVGWMRRLRARQRESLAVRQQLFDFDELRTPERKVAGLQELKLLQTLIAELPPRCRHVFLLHRIYGIQFGDIAAQLGISERMVRKHMVRALIYCRAGLAALKRVGPHG